MADATSSKILHGISSTEINKNNANKPNQKESTKSAGLEMTIDDTIGLILKDASPERIQFVANAFKKKGVTSSEELKYYDWKNLGKVGGLTDMEIKEIMAYVQRSYTNVVKKQREATGTSSTHDHDQDTSTGPSFFGPSVMANVPRPLARIWRKINPKYLLIGALLLFVLVKPEWVAKYIPISPDVLQFISAAICILIAARFTYRYIKRRQRRRRR